MRAPCGVMHGKASEVFHRDLGTLKVRITLTVGCLLSCHKQKGIQSPAADLICAPRVSACCKVVACVLHIMCLCNAKL